MGKAKPSLTKTQTKIRVLGFDPGYANWGLARGTLTFDPDNPETPTISIELIDLQNTSRSNLKTVRRNSDDMSRAASLHSFVTSHMTAWQPRMVFSEIPSGAQSANAAKGFGITIGLLAAVAPNLIQVMPSEVKIAFLGDKTASKQDMIDRAYKLHKSTPGWIRHANRLTLANEHQADAIATIYAGIQTPEFAQMWSVIQ